MKTHTVLFAAPITPAVANEFIQTLAQLHRDGATHVVLAMNSNGGHVQSGMFMYNVLCSMPFELTTHNIGNVDSIANVIFLSGKQRYTCQAATFMYHGVGFDLTANQRLEEKQLEGLLDTVLADQQRMSDVISSRTSLSTGACMELFKNQKTRDAAWAKQNGLVSEIRDFTYPDDGDIIIFSR